jgi:hypothetical protein
MSEPRRRLWSQQRIESCGVLTTSVAGAEFLSGRIVAILDPGLRVWGRLALGKGQ